MGCLIYLLLLLGIGNLFKVVYNGYLLLFKCGLLFFGVLFLVLLVLFLFMFKIVCFVDCRKFVGVMVGIFIYILVL